MWNFILLKGVGYFWAVEYFVIVVLILGIGFSLNPLRLLSLFIHSFNKILEFSLFLGRTSITLGASEGKMLYWKLGLSHYLLDRFKPLLDSVIKGWTKKMPSRGHQCLVHEVMMAELQNEISRCNNLQWMSNGVRKLVSSTTTRRSFSLSHYVGSESLFLQFK